MDLVQVDKYNDVWRSIIREIENLNSYAEQESLPPGERENVHYTLAALKIARMVCLEVRKMATATLRGSPRVARQRYNKACNLVDIFWGCVLQLGIERIYTYEFLDPIIDDFPGPFAA